MNSRPEISVIIPSYNAKESLIACLESICSQQFSKSYEIIVVDSSEDDISDFIKKEFPQTRILHLKERTYPGVARNIGVSEAKGELIVFTDADCIVAERWLQNIYNEFQSKRANVIGGSIRNGYPNNLIATAEYLMEFGEFLPEKQEGYLSMLPSCNFGIEKTIFEKIGGFPNFITAEDVLFSHKVKESGGSIYFNPSIQITHFNRRNLSLFLDKQRELGIGSCILRRSVRMRGSALTRHRIFSWLIPFVRVYTVWKKVVLNHWKYLGKLVITFPVMFLGLWAYAFGFWQGFQLPINNGRGGEVYER